MGNAKFINAEQISEKFIKDGWSKDTSFTELSLEEAKENGYSFVISRMAKGEKFFKMNVNGNIYNDKGKIILYNIKTSTKLT